MDLIANILVFMPQVQVYSILPIIKERHELTRKLLRQFSLTYSRALTYEDALDETYNNLDIFLFCDRAHNYMLIDFTKLIFIEIEYWKPFEMLILRKFKHRRWCWYN